MIDTLISENPNIVKKPIDAIYIIDGDHHGLYDIYLEFVLYWIKSDAQSYRNTSMIVTGREEKDLLSFMVVKKMEMFNIFRKNRGNDYKEWFEPTSVKSFESGNGHWGTDLDARAIQSIDDAFYFAFQKEYQGLALFEKIGGSGLGEKIRILMESAAEHQRQFILFLDAKLSCVRRQRGRMYELLDTVSERTP